MEGSCVFKYYRGENKKRITIDDSEFCVSLIGPKRTRLATCHVSCNEDMYNNLWELETQISITTTNGQLEQILSGTEYANNTTTQSIIFNCYKKSSEFECKDFRDTSLVKIKLLKIKGKIPDCCFDFEEPGFSDVTFLIGEKRVYAHRSILSVHSPYFSSMFLSNFAEKSMEEITLEAVVFEEFVELLNAVYPTNHQITENNYVTLMKMADMYQIESVLTKCENFIKTNDNISLYQKLEYAEKYSFTSLEAFCFGKLKSAKDILQLFQSETNVPQQVVKRDIHITPYFDYSAQPPPVVPSSPVKSIDKLNMFEETMQMKLLERYAKLFIPNCEFHTKNTTKNCVDQKDSIEKRLEDWKDTIVKVDDVEVLVNRAYLSIHSHVLQKKLYEAQVEGVVELSGVKCNDFLELLSYIYQADKQIPAQNIDGLLSLAYSLEVPSVMNRCEQFFINRITDIDVSNFSSTIPMFNLAESYQLSGIQECLLKKFMKSKNKLDLIIANPVFEAMGAKSRLALLRCFFLCYQQ